MKKQLAFAVMVSAAASPAFAQQESEFVAAKLAAEQSARSIVADKIALADFEMQGAAPLRTATVVESRVVTGRPYSAEVTTEFVQVLGDGNKISRKSTVRVFRDSDGRTRREDMGTGDTLQSVSINDPVSGEGYMLDPKTRTAFKAPARSFVVSMPPVKVPGESGGAISIAQAPEAGVRASGDAVEIKRKIEEVAGTAAAGRVVVRARTAEPVKVGAGEPLGQQMMGGVMAEGTRTTTIVAAGEIGNEREIRVVSEQWYSPELEVIVMTRHSDPRSGETVYRLSNIVRAEPGAGLFEVPSDYTLKESPFRLNMRKDPVMR